MSIEDSLPGCLVRPGSLHPLRMDDMIQSDRRSGKGLWDLAIRVVLTRPLGDPVCMFRGDWGSIFRRTRIRRMNRRKFGSLGIGKMWGRNDRCRVPND
jgi:hypothetical protein